MKTMTPPKRTEPTRPARGARPRLALVAAALVVVAGIGLLGLSLTGGGHPTVADRGPAAVAPQNPEPLPTATAAAPALTTAATAAPDWPGIVRSILGYDLWLKTHPDPKLLGTYMDPTNPDYADGLDKLGQFAHGELRWVEPPPALTASGVAFRAQDGQRASLLVTLNPRQGGSYADRTGHVTSLSATPGGQVVWLLVLSPDGHWRIAGASAAA